MELELQNDQLSIKLSKDNELRLNDNNFSLLPINKNSMIINKKIDSNVSYSYTLNSVNNELIVEVSFWERDAI